MVPLSCTIPLSRSASLYFFSLSFFPPRASFTLSLNEPSRIREPRPTIRDHPRLFACYWIRYARLSICLRPLNADTDSHRCKQTFYASRWLSRSIISLVRETFIFLFFHQETSIYTNTLVSFWTSTKGKKKERSKEGVFSVAIFRCSFIFSIYR